MNRTLSLSQWLTAPRPVTTPVAWPGEYTWVLGYLQHDVAPLIDHLRDQSGNHWAPCFRNSYLSTAALLAALYPGKTPVVPGHNRAALLSVQCSLFDCALSDKRLGWNGPQSVVSISHQVATNAIASDDIISDVFIELFTSGSTGRPKQIVKPLANLDQETNILATHFADRLLGYRSVAPVTLQHLYGLTFRIFLPTALGLLLHTIML